MATKKAAAAGAPLSAHQQHVAHVAHVNHVASLNNAGVLDGNKTGAKAKPKSGYKTGKMSASAPVSTSYSKKK
jgi:prephenate dehydrogenase